MHIQMDVYHIHWEWIIFKADINYSIRPVSKEYEFHCKVSRIGKTSCDISCFKEIYIFTQALLYMRHPRRGICIFSPCRVQMRTRFRILNSWNGLINALQPAWAFRLQNKAWGKEGFESSVFRLTLSFFLWPLDFEKSSEI